ncbi:MAG: hypothetical protein WD627_11565, partial [Actinomycetota bacterium]
MKKLVATLAIVGLLAACGGRQESGQASAPRPASFVFEGKVVSASRSKNESSAGRSKAGSITLQLSTSQTSLESCSIRPPRVVVIPFGPDTS